MAQGYTDEGQTTEAIGAIVTLVGIGWSVYDKHQRKAAK
jgi:hypothetical protein